MFATGAGFEQPARDGFELRVVGEDIRAPAWRAIDGLGDGGAAILDTQTDPGGRQLFGVEQVFATERLRTGFGELAAIADDFDPDVFIHDPAELAAPLIASSRGRPNVCVGYLLPFDGELLAGAVRAMRPRWESFGLEIPDDAGLYRHLYLDPCPPSLADSSVESVASAHPMRPVLPLNATDELPAEVAALRGRPLVYATLGTVFTLDLTPLATVVEGLRCLPVHVVATVGPDGDPAAVDDPGDPGVVVKRFIPHAALLPRCSVVITYGGAGSVVGPLSLGIPLVIIPQGADQFENAAAVDRAGAGLMIMPSELTATRVAEAVERVRSDRAVRDAERRVADEITEMPTPDDAVEALQRLLR